MGGLRVREVGGGGVEGAGGGGWGVEGAGGGGWGGYIWSKHISIFSTEHKH